MIQPPSETLLAPLGPWFEAARRLLPWRAEDLDAPHPDPYAVLVSELMLQQTQVATVLPYFGRWMARFPDARSLAEASEDAVHALWAGLGYYRRARLLQGGARSIAAGGWPADFEGLLALPGLGPYTAAAVASIAFQWPEPALAGNAFRVLARLLCLDGDPRKQAPGLRSWLRPALAALGPSRMTQAIMELGATLCLPHPRCAACPLESACLARARGLEASLPPAAPRPAPRKVELWLLALESQGRWLLHRPAAKGLLAGLWRWPALECPSQAPFEGAAESPAPFGLGSRRAWRGWNQVYSHRVERIHPVAIELDDDPGAPPGMAWITRDSLADLPMGARDQRLRALLDQPGEAESTLPDAAPILKWLKPGP